MKCFTLSYTLALLFCSFASFINTGDADCKTMRCGHYSNCRVINGTAKCLCDMKCETRMAPVCGSNDVTYGNMCLMKMQACFSQKMIYVKYPGICSIHHKNCTSLPLPPSNSKYIKDVHGNNRVYCLHGYFRQGDPRVKCRNGRWEIFATCHKKACALPRHIDNGRIEYGRLSVGSKVLYKCGTCFYLDGLKERECLANETWSGKEPRCKPIDCGHMLKDWELENGIVFGLDTYCGSTMEFQCMEGYELVGTPSVICQANGKWSATKPKCHLSEISGDGTSFDGDTLKQCIGLESPKNGRIKNLVFEETYTPGHEITFECFDQYELIGTSKLTCMDNGNWSHPAPSCNLSRCIDAEAQAPEGGNRYGKNLIGETQSFFCEKDKMLIGSAFIHCRKNGTWSSKPPVCKPYCDDVKCEDGQKCVYQVSKRKTDCICMRPSECSKSFEPVCGSDGVTYDNECLMKSFACFKNETLDVIKTGSCSEEFPADETMNKDRARKCPQCDDPKDICNKINSSNFTLVGKIIYEEDFSFLMRLKKVVKDSMAIAHVEKNAMVFKISSNPGCFCFPGGIKGDVIVTGSYITSQKEDLAFVAKEDDYIGMYYGMKQIKPCF